MKAPKMRYSPADWAMAIRGRSCESQLLSTISPFSGLRVLRKRLCEGCGWRSDFEVLRGEFGGVFALRSLFGDTQHRADFGP